MICVILVLDMMSIAIGCVNGMYGVFREFIIGFDELLIITHNVRLR